VSARVAGSSQVAGIDGAMRFLFLSLLALLSACVSRPPAPAPRPAGAPVTILISIDAFRPDYLHRGITPNLDALAAGGVSAEMRPSFPTKTYPNHYTLVTGLRPDRHGIVGNKMRDPSRPDDLFSMQNSTDPFWWQGGEPIWVAAERAGIRTASLFWPGQQAPVKGIQPRDWLPYDGTMPARARVERVLEWVRRPAAERPRFVALYFDTVDEATHHNGVGSAEGKAAIGEVDAEIGRLKDGLAAMGQAANIVIVSDHGMAASSRERVIMLDRYAAPADYLLGEEGANLSLYPRPGREAALAGALVGRHDHFSCWRPGEMPARFRYGRNRRVAPVFCLPDEGWLIYATPHERVDFGSHGYDNDLPAMRATFIANGPAFVGGKRLRRFDNVDVYPLLRDLLALPPAADVDGNDAPFRGVLRR
jgi:predicted AlkP superfamily pyrophosphatase or phosphodiesterase